MTTPMTPRTRQLLLNYRALLRRCVSSNEDTWVYKHPNWVLGEPTEEVKLARQQIKEIDNEIQEARYD